MALRIKNFLLVIFLLLIPLSSVEGFTDGMLPHYSLHKDGIQMNYRKLLIISDAILDYEDAEANPKHDPRKKPGNGSGKP